MALGREAYRQDRIRIVDRDVRGFECLATTRQGLFAVARSGASKVVAHGLFFGIWREGGGILLFEACDSPRTDSGMGRLLRIAIRDGRLENERIIAKGLPNGCHQVAVVDDHICVVDTDDQAVWRYHPDGRAIDIRRPFADPRSLRDPGVYHHPNAIAGWEGGALLMLHNGAGDMDAPSALAWCDADWIIRRETILPGYWCHDIVIDEAGTVWHCGSKAGELINSDGLCRKVSERMTRGLLVTPDLIVFGASNFGERAMRDDLNGAVTFLDRAFRQLGEAVLPSGPVGLAKL